MFGTGIRDTEGSKTTDNFVVSQLKLFNDSIVAKTGSTEFKRINTALRISRSSRSGNKDKHTHL